MTERERIIERARKLLALGESDNEHEAALAVSRAQALLEAHDIAMADVTASTQAAEPMVEESLTMGRRNIAQWKVYLASTLARANGCSLYYVGPTVYVCGQRSRAERVTLFVTAVAAEIDRIALKSCKGRGRSYANSFRVGAVSAIQAMLREQSRETRAEAQAQGASSRALVVVDTLRAEAQAWRDSRHNLSPPGRGATVSSGGGYAAGRAAGAAAYGNATRGRVAGGSAGRLGSGA